MTLGNPPKPLLPTTCNRTFPFFCSTPTARPITPRRPALTTPYLLQSSTHFRSLSVRFAPPPQVLKNPTVVVCGLVITEVPHNLDTASARNKQGAFLSPIFQYISFQTYAKYPQSALVATQASSPCHHNATHLPLILTSHTRTLLTPRQLRRHSVVSFSAHAFHLNYVTCRIITTATQHNVESSEFVS